VPVAGEYGLTAESPGFPIVDCWEGIMPPIVELAKYLVIAQLTCYTDYVQKNLTLTLDENLLRTARKVALDRNTSVNQLVRDYLARLVRETDQRQGALARLEEVFRTNRIKVGRRTWKREDLHDRR
jgi:hypothetical protein